jgi:hypothetical protein
VLVGSILAGYGFKMCANMFAENVNGVNYKECPLVLTGDCLKMFDLATL